MIEPVSTTYRIDCKDSTLRAEIKKTSEGYELVSNFRFTSGNYYQNQKAVFKTSLDARRDLYRLAKNAGGILPFIP